MKFSASGTAGISRVRIDVSSEKDVAGQGDLEFHVEYRSYGSEAAREFDFGMDNEVAEELFSSLLDHVRIRLRHADERDRR